MFNTKHVTQRNAVLCYLMQTSSVCILLSSPDAIPSPRMHRYTAPPRGRETEISSINSSGDLYHRTFQLCQRRGPHPPRPVSFTPFLSWIKAQTPKQSEINTAVKLLPASQKTPHAPAQRRGPTVPRRRIRGSFWWICLKRFESVSKEPD